jgi:hypothetical protein
MTPDEYTHRGQVLRALGDDRRRRVLFEARMLGIETRRRRDAELAVDIVEAARRQRREVRL